MKTQLGLIAMQLQEVIFLLRFHLVKLSGLQVTLVLMMQERRMQINIFILALDTKQIFLKSKTLTPLVGGQTTRTLGKIHHIHNTLDLKADGFGMEMKQGTAI